jgi:hypothetical protein
MKFELSRQIIEKYSNTKFNKNPSSESRIVPWGKKDRDMTKLIAAFRIFANAPKNTKHINAFCGQNVEL